MYTKEKVALIIGAGSGLGRATALELAGKGFIVGLCALSSEGIKKVASEIKSQNGKAFMHIADARKEEDVNKMFKNIKEKYGKLDMLVCSVGKGLIKATTDVSYKEMENIWIDNFVPVFLTNRAALELMKPQKSGLIVNISTRVALRAIKLGKPGVPISVYIAGKAAVSGFSFAFATEASEFGVNVLCMAPAPMDTPSRWRSTPNFDPKRTMKPEQVANFIGYAASNPDIILEGAVVPVSINF